MSTTSSWIQRCWSAEHHRGRRPLLSPESCAGWDSWWKADAHQPHWSCQSQDDWRIGDGFEGHLRFYDEKCVSASWSEEWSSRLWTYHCREPSTGSWDFAAMGERWSAVSRLSHKMWCRKENVFAISCWESAMAADPWPWLCSWKETQEETSWGLSQRDGADVCRSSQASSWD